MLIRRVLVILAVFSAAYTATHADDSAPTTGTGLELFAAFKTFCVDTGASPDAMKAAVEAVRDLVHIIVIGLADHVVERPDNPGDALEVA
jgi:hypothetical protein